MKGVQCYDLFGGIALINCAFYIAVISDFEFSLLVYGYC